MRRKVIMWSLAAAGIGFLILIVVLIARTPDPGAPSAQELASSYQRAVVESDQAMEALVYSPPEYDEYLLRALREPDGCGDPTKVTARATAAGAGLGFLELADAAGRACARLAIAEHDGRWFLDAWAAPWHRT
jgi:NADPH-dependent 2,4-dienoyl-CoA reductase/sulfur reductase-like enzyme